ncbi:right-handed parallel beta-helix repeat-containing protein [Pseudonocardia thermophila]|uniref:right-handed parallel beta-helix repeat-containing protein n=1 Tax=Pseudonocardia thermophila TaxID=1848 RepID=UPI000936581E|nr:right-handed parallel beta-helix repeat-containing protein [Pseudonocardia thermophila]
MSPNAGPPTGPVPPYGGPPTGHQPLYQGPHTQPQPPVSATGPVPPLPDTVRIPGGSGGSGGSGPDEPRFDRRILIGGAGAIALLAVIAVVLVITLSGGSEPGGKLGPQPGVASQEHGRRPIAQIEPTSGRTLTVAQDGSGQFTSIAEAAEETRPGDTVVISSGTYEEALMIPHSGTQGAYITYTAAPGAEVVITGDTDTDGLVELREQSWIKLIGLSIRGSSEHGLYAAGSSHVVVQDVEVADSEHGGIVFIDGSDIQVLHTEVRNSNAMGTDAKNEAISMSNIDGFEIAYSIVEDCGEEGIDAKYEARNGKIHDNTTRGNRGPNIYVDAAHAIEIYNNTVVGATGEGKAGIFLGVEDVSETRRTYDVKIYNNVITGNRGGGINFFVESDGTFSDLSIINNTIADNDGDGINPRDYDFTGTNVLRNNLVVGNTRDSAGDMSVFTADHNLFGTGPVGANPVEGAVEFVDAEAGDLRLAPDSAGIGAGSPDGAPRADVLGVARPEDKIDLGAFQSQG